MVYMDSNIKLHLEEANKLIFVKKYEEARDTLKTILKEKNGKCELLIHLRIIELSAQMGQLEELKQDYEQKLHANIYDKPTFDIAVNFLNLFGGNIPCQEVISRFSSIMEESDPVAVNAAAIYFGIGYSFEIQENYDRAIYNYKESINHDDSWGPSYFGLSQIYYGQNDDVQGDYYFYQFESLSPYNLYGNFETHKNLCQEFLDAEKYEDAESAIKALSEWWVENKGMCPIEIKVYELLMLYKISQYRKSAVDSSAYLAKIDQKIYQAMQDDEVKEDVLYFIAKALDDHSLSERSIEVYKRVLDVCVSDVNMIQKIGQRFLGNDDIDAAYEVFLEAYKKHPDNSEIKFCHLVMSLKKEGINVQEYLKHKESLVEAREASSGQVENLSLLYKLLDIFDQDSDVHAGLGEVHMRLGNQARAKHHYKKMYDLAYFSIESSLTYISFLIQTNQVKDALSVLAGIRDKNLSLSNQESSEVRWMYAQCYYMDGEPKQALSYLRKALDSDPWNINYLIVEIQCLTALSKIDHDISDQDAVLKLIAQGSDLDMDWAQFGRLSTLYSEAHEFELCYSRSKVQFLYDRGQEASLRRLLDFAVKYDACQAAKDFIKLLNTNFDCPLVYLGLGLLSKQLWQLEVAVMWLNQLVEMESLSNEIKGEAYRELADAQVWIGKNLDKAEEFSKISSELMKDDKAKNESVLIMAHAKLKQGKTQLAQEFLNIIQSDRSRGESENIEFLYLQGLLLYRNGQVNKAKIIWKPLITISTDTVKAFHIKQEVIKYYFNGDSYLRAN